MVKHIKINNEIIFGKDLVVIAGPCSVESYEQTSIIAKAVKTSGANILRGGAFKPRTSPTDFQGLGLEGLKILAKVGFEEGMPVISEIMSENDLAIFEEYVDIIQVGARNMQNYALLKVLGRATKPVLLKRGMGATVKEWISASKYITEYGNENVILCERGIKTFDTETRSTLDLSSVLTARGYTDLPIIVDPSHAAGTYELVTGLSLAAIGVGANGLMVEVHNNPEVALSDGMQSLKPKRFDELMLKIKALEKCLKEVNEL